MEENKIEQLEEIMKEMKEEELKGVWEVLKLSIK